LPHCSGSIERLETKRASQELNHACQNIDQFVELMLPLGLVEVSRSGVVAISRGPEAM
jgi:acetolactate synthase small subunit